MPLWSTRSCIWRAVSASYAFNGGSRPRAAVCVPFAPVATRQIRIPTKVIKLPQPAPRAVVLDHEPLPPELEARIAARVSRERAQATLNRPAATKRNGGVRGSTATRWSR